MISVLIPTYNYNITNLVTKIHTQLTKSKLQFEIIVLDDASNDKNSTVKNQEIKNLEYCFYSENNKNRGRTVTRNLLANSAKYNWLLFLDADVLPKHKDFIDKFQLKKNRTYQVIYGGVCYYNKKPKNDTFLRWKYGKEREAKTVSERLKEPHFIISQNLLIQKEVFLTMNTIQTNNYGLDILFSNNLKENNISIKHINNPVYHLGLENNFIFLKKSLEAVKTTYILEKKGLLSSTLRPLQKAYINLKNYGLVYLFYTFTNLFSKLIINNLKSKNPSLFLFDIFKLNYFCKLKLNQ